MGPIEGAGEVTFVRGGKLLDTTGCLLAGAAESSSVTWGGAADRVVVGNTITLAGQPAAQTLGAGAIVLSRPTGKAVLRVGAGGRLEKREIDSDDWRDISFLAKHETAVYHPAGRSIVSTGTDEDGKATLAIADNEGRGPKPLLDNESAKHINDPVFTASGALLFTADHGDHVDLHRLEIDAAKLTTVAAVNAPATIDNITTSPFEGGGVAWTTGDCASKTPPVMTAERGGAFFPLAGTQVAGARPVGWLPDGRLLAIDGQTCATGAPGTLLVLKGAELEVVAHDVTAAAVRAVLPPPPPPPPSISQQAPA